MLLLRAPIRAGSKEPSTSRVSRLWLDEGAPALRSRLGMVAGRSHRWLYHYDLHGHWRDALLVRAVRMPVRRRTRRQASPGHPAAFWVLNPRGLTRPDGDFADVALAADGGHGLPILEMLFDNLALELRTVVWPGNGSGSFDLEALWPHCSESNPIDQAAKDCLDDGGQFTRHIRGFRV